MKKLQFVLDIDDGWPPVASEGVWCDCVGDHYKLKNVPFFIRGLAADDIFKTEPDSVNGHIFEFEIIEESGHSVVWLINNTGLDLSIFRKKITDLGCNYEGLPQFSLVAIDVPPQTNLETLDAIIDEYEEKGIEFAYPVWRFDE